MVNAVARQCPRRAPLSRDHRLPGSRVAFGRMQMQTHCSCTSTHHRNMLSTDRGCAVGDPRAGRMDVHALPARAYFASVWFNFVSDGLCFVAVVRFYICPPLFSRLFSFVLVLPSCAPGIDRLVICTGNLSSRLRCRSNKILYFRTLDSTQLCLVMYVRRYRRIGHVSWPVYSHLPALCPPRHIDTSTDFAVHLSPRIPVL